MLWMYLNLHSTNEGDGVIALPFRSAWLPPRLSFSVSNK